MLVLLGLHHHRGVGGKAVSKKSCPIHGVIPTGWNRAHYKFCTPALRRLVRAAEILAPQIYRDHWDASTPAERRLVKAVIALEAERRAQ